MYLSKAIEHIVNTTNPSTDDLLGLTQQFPYFAVPHIVLSAKNKNGVGNSFHQKLQLFTPNNSWLQFIINETTITEPTLLSIDDIQFEKNKLIEPITQYDTQTVYTNTSNNTNQTETNNSHSTSTTVNETPATELDSEIPVFEPVHFGPTITEEPVTIANNGIANNTAALEPNIPVSNNFANIPNNKGGNNQPIEVPSLETVRMLLQGKTPGTNTVEPNVEDKFEPTQPAISILEEPIAATPATQIPSYQFNGFANGTPYTNSNTVELSENYANNIEIAEDEEELENQNEPLENTKLSSILSTQAFNFNKPVDADAKLDFETEPFYTVDYFASQGIKIDLTKQPQDKLTLQLRRFTDWLKQIKKADPNPTDLGTDPELEKAIQNIAQTSLEAREIVTETMADVFIKQGKTEKAIQLYIKLSFLDPHKSTYFAKKIEQLKGI